MDFIVHTNLETLPSIIDFNHEKLKQWLSDSLEHYNSLVVTEDSIKEAKADKAKLNALKKAIDDKRKEIKKACLSPYEAFEEKVKELLALIDAPVLAIDGQIKAFDEIEKNKKRAEIEAHYGGAIGDLADLLPLSKLWDERWLNVTFKMSEIQKAISDSVAKVGADLKIIKDMALDCEQRVIDVYLQTLDMSRALEEKTRYEEQQRRIAEYEAKKAPAPIKAEDVTYSATAADIVEPTTPTEQTKTIKVIFYDTTAAFRADMKDLTERHNITYGGIQ